MARARNLKPSFYLNTDLAKIEPLGRILFSGLWCLADRKGRLEDNYLKIKAQVLPYDDTDINKLLDSLHAAKFIIRYKKRSENYIQIVNFDKHQHPHIKEPESTIPAPDKNESKPVRKRPLIDSLLPITDSLNPLFVPGALELAERLKEWVLKNNPTARVPYKLDAWVKDADLILRLDKRPLKEAQDLVDWCQKDQFWKANILSVGKFREKYDQLKMKMNGGTNGSGSKGAFGSGSGAGGSKIIVGEAKPTPGAYEKFSK